MEELTEYFVFLSSNCGAYFYSCENTFIQKPGYFDQLTDYRFLKKLIRFLIISLQQPAL